MHARALGMVFAIVASAVLIDGAEWLNAFAQEGLAGVVLVANHIAELVGMLNKIADHTHVLAHGISTDNADAVQTGAVHGFKVLAEQLVQAADHQHRRTVCGKRTQQVGAMVEVVDDFLLAGVLAAASQNKVHLVGPVVALIVLVDDRFITVQFQTAADSQHVAGIAVDVHVFGIQGHHINCSGHVAFSLSMSSR